MGTEEGKGDRITLLVTADNLKYYAVTAGHIWLFSMMHLFSLFTNDREVKCIYRFNNT